MEDFCMPYIHVQTNVPVSDAQAETVKARLGQAISALPGKSEKWLMVRMESECAMWMAGSDEPCAMVDVSVYGGAPSDAYEVLTARVCEILDAVLSLDPARVYVKFSETPDWGWNGGNF